MTPEVRVGNTSVATSVAYAISEHALDQQADGRAVDVAVRAVVGSVAVATAMKALTIARGTLATKGLDICVLPGFDDAEDRGGGPLTIQVLRMIERRP